jgi:hypothetical protein
MNNLVSITDFRKNIFSYIDFATAKQKQIGVSKDKKIVGWFVPNTKINKIKQNKVDVFLTTIEDLQKKYPFKGGKNLSRDIDRILYGKK